MRGLYQETKFDAYPMPRIEELLDEIGKAKFITTLDLAKGYWQVPLASKDREKTAFTTPNGVPIKVGVGVGVGVGVC